MSSKLARVEDWVQRAKDASFRAGELAQACGCMDCVGSGRKAAWHERALRRSLGKAVALATWLLAAIGHGQGTMQPIHITFDGPPPQPPGSRYSVLRYEEGGMAFTPLGFSSFTRAGMSPRPASGAPDSGTAYIAAALTQSLKFEFTNGSLFDLVSVDLAEYSTLFAEPLTVHFVGYRFDGSTVTADLTTDGIIDGTGPLEDFQTFTFGPEFSGLRRVEIPTSLWSLDNVIVVVPEPSAVLLIFPGALLLAAGRFRRRASRGGAEADWVDRAG